MSRCAIADALVDQLRLVPEGIKPRLGEIRLAIAAELGACSMGDISTALQRLRFQGKIEWDRLALAPSMRTERAVEPARVPPVATVKSEPAPPPAAPPARAPVEEQAEYPEASGTAREASGAASSGAASRDIVSASPSSLPERPTGLQLLAEIDAFLERNPSMTKQMFGRQCLGADIGYYNIRNAKRPQQRTVDKVRAFVAGIVPPRPACHNAPDCDVDPRPRETAHDAAVRRGRNAQASRAGQRPMPAPALEPEVARAAREEATRAGERRHLAKSTGTVVHPLEIPGLTLVEQVTTALAEHPHDLIQAISRRHGEAWRRIVLVGRERRTRPSLVLYDVLEAGLAALERQPIGESVS